jgi:hypothetical protein
LTTGLSAHGVGVTLPAGFEGRVFRRPGFGEVAESAADGPPAPPGEVPNTVMHVATIALPPDTGDFASGVVDRLQGDDVLVVLFEYASASIHAALFAHAGVPRALRADDFSPTVLQRVIPGQAGVQFFAHEAGRAFCLYVVLGSYARRKSLVDRVNALLATLVIDPLPPGVSAAPAPTTTTGPSTTTTSPATTAPPPTTAPPSTTSPSTTSTTPPSPPTTTTP